MATASFLVELKHSVNLFDYQAQLDIDFQQFVVDHVSPFIKECLKEFIYFGRWEIVLFFHFGLVIAQPLVFNHICCGRQWKIALLIMKTRWVRETNLYKVFNASIIGVVQNLLNWNLCVESKVGDG